MPPPLALGARASIRGIATNGNDSQDTIRNNLNPNFHQFQTGAEMKKLLNTAFVLAVLLCNSALANSYKFTFTIDSNHEVGYLTIPQELFEAQVDSSHTLAIGNVHIDEFKFQLNNQNWSTNHINRDGGILFQYFGTGSLPKLKSSTDFLATLDDGFSNMDIPGFSWMVIGDDLVNGVWTTSVTAVPEPSTLLLFALSLPLLAIAVRRKS